MEQKITVAVRIRPALEKERFQPLCARKADDGQSIIIKHEKEFAEPVVFQFDDVFDEMDDQCSVYEQSVQELVDHALQGANSTIFTYGQTGSGKTYTILGSLSESGITEESGIFLRVFCDLFSYRNSRKNQMHIIIFLSAVELYVEDVMDLLEQHRKIKLRETPEETIMPGINTVEVKSMNDVIQCFRKANTYRSVTSTKMNDSSSRSHALFFIDIFQAPIACCPICPSKEQLMDSNGIPLTGGIDGLLRSRISLVDLAGSERVKRSGVEGQAMVEAQSINKSLSALGTSINAMYMESKHVPFRESKLTKLLKNSFVDRTSRLLLIGQVAPPSDSAQESQGTLRFCDRVKSLKAGKVVGFVDPEEEARYLRSLRVFEELTAELRVAKVQYYYEVQRMSLLARLKGVSLTDFRQMVITHLKSNSESIRKAKEEEEIRRREAEIQKEYDDEARMFVKTVNTMIEEYEIVASEVKKEKKAAKRAIEEETAMQDEWITKAKKAKKHRVRVEKCISEVTAALKESADQLAQLETDVREPGDKRVIREGPEGNEASNADDKGVHALVECFHTHATELGRLHELYVQRLSATQRQRSNVRRAKLFSSEIITDSTLIYDIIDFVTKRAVDISDGVISPSQRYSWHDIDGLSTVLRSGEQWYPPLFTYVRKEDMEASNVPVVFHKITFLSEDDSDGENSHYPHETRRRFIEKGLVRDGDDKDGSPSRSSLTVEDTTELPTKGGVHKVPGVLNGVALFDEDRDENESGTHTGPLDTGSAPDSDDERANGEKAEAVKRMEHKKYLMRVYDSPTLVQELLRFMRGGTVMVKHGRHGKPHRRVFWISSVQSVRQLLWMDPNSKAAVRSSINLDEVGYLQLGCFSSVFRRHPMGPTDPAFYRCFSIGLKNGNRTVDVVASSLPDLEAWIVGLSYLVHVDPVWGGKLDITKEKDFDLLNCFEANLCEANYIYPIQFIALKKRVQRVATRTLETLQECGNDPQKAHEKLGGIHLPAINDKGAVLLTKGELRSLANEEIDILRITKVWILFNQMNLIFDDNFVPATTFGVTHRR